MDVLSQFLKLANSQHLKIIVVGDSLVDEYYAVRVSRVSPEFPIPVLHSETDEPISTVPGGAANVCSQLKHWNSEVHIVTAWDNTSYQILNDNKIGCNYVTNIQNWNIPRKKRFYDGDFPLDRWDVETKVQKTNSFEWSAARSQLLQNFAKALKEVRPDIVILSDYGKGMFVAGAENISQPIIQLCNRYGVPTIVDPKTINCDFWKNCTIIKPNADWAKGFYEKYNREECKKSHHWNEESAFIQDQLNCKSVVLTDSGNGVCVYNGEESCFYPSPVLSKTRPVIRSVIGAGDCFCAFFAMSYALGIHLEGSVQVAFNGASAYIEDKHNNPVTPYQFWKWHNPIEAKKVTINELIKIRKNTPNQTWVWTNGCFDAGLHTGHLKTFAEAKKLGSILVVGLNTDESVKRLKGDNRPKYTYKDREEILANISNVDFIVPIEGDTPYEEIKTFHPDKIVKGSDYIIEGIHGWDIVGRDNVHLVDLNNHSTTKTLNSVELWEISIEPHGFQTDNYKFTVIGEEEANKFALSLTAINVSKDKIYIKKLS